MFCKYCGAQLPDDAVFCDNCGAKMQAAPVTQPVSAPGDANMPIQPVSVPGDANMPIQQESVSVQPNPAYIPEQNVQPSPAYRSGTEYQQAQGYQSGAAYQTPQNYQRETAYQSAQDYQTGAGYQQTQGYQSGVPYQQAQGYQPEFPYQQPYPPVQAPEQEGKGHTGMIIGIVAGVAAVALIVVGIIFVLPRIRSRGVDKPDAEEVAKVECLNDHTTSGDGFELSFRYPEGWSIETPESDVMPKIVQMCDEDGNRLDIYKSSVLAGLSSIDEEELAESYAEDVDVQEVTRFTMGGQPAVKVVYEAQEDGEDVVVEQNMVNSGDYLFTMVFTTADYKENAPVFSAILDTVSLAETAGYEAVAEEEPVYEEEEYIPVEEIIEEPVEVSSGIPPIEQLKNNNITETIYLTDLGSENRLTMYPDGSYEMRVNLYEGYGNVTGQYSYKGNTYGFEIFNRDFSGFVGDDMKYFEMAPMADAGLQYYTSSGGLGDIFYGRMLFISDADFTDYILTKSDLPGLDSADGFFDGRAIQDLADIEGLYAYPFSSQGEGGIVDREYSIEIVNEIYDNYSIKIEMEDKVETGMLEFSYGKGNKVPMYDQNGNFVHMLTFVYNDESYTGCDTIYLDEDLDKAYLNMFTW